MSKKEFLKKLKKALKNDTDKVELVNYYEELIDEAVLNGEKEDDVIARLGTVSEIISAMGKERPKDMKSDKQNSNSKSVFRIIGLIGYLLLSLLLLSMAFSGGAALFINLTEVFKPNKSTVIFYYIFQMLIAIALVLIASSVFVNILKKMKLMINKLSLTERSKQWK